jgi:ABC-type transport system involved in cytochrome c biogenesis permease subunit
MIGGLSLHAVGLLMRMMILERAPVSTLYESVIFVGFICVLLSMIYEILARNTLGILGASVAGSLLHFIGFSYAADGDSMGMLVAVLNSNFWLSTHVVTITIGYGCSFVSGVMAHFYLLQRFFRPGKKEVASRLFKTLLTLCTISLFFTTLGTILGGIWADQSWGRFWGWDPKENGAMLIVLWLLMLLHGRFSGHLRETGFAGGLALTNIVVALAWFGVNLLNVGLHSYGFTESIAMKLMAFCAFEIFFAVFTVSWLKLKFSRN